ncbi:MAG TPA: ectonucleotide pyrophosphatase/phosphodiesterase [Lacunisphaera sp.]
MRRLPVILLVLVSLAVTACQSPVARRPDGPLILISIDGFRWDYLQQYDVPTLRALAASGVHAKRMTPCFPTATFPSHYTLVTGLYPEHHGIVSNIFFDTALGARFVSKSAESAGDSRWWEGGEPIWITAEKQGVRSACVFWPGSEAAIHGVRPSLFKNFDNQLTCLQRVENLLGWLERPPGDRPKFGVLYFNNVDVTGHSFGPDAPETAAAVHEADTAIARLLEGLAQLGLRESANLVIVSDHGMEPVSIDRTLVVEDYLEPGTFEMDFAGPVAGLRPKPGTTAEELANRLRGRHPQLNVWLRQEVPARLHYRASDRITPVVVLANPGWELSNREWIRTHRLTFERGSHGYDPATPNMGALFIAHGPAFRQYVTIDDVESIHVYDLLCAALGITPAPNDGDQSLARLALRR